MTTTPVYDKLLSEIDDATERAVLTALMEHTGQPLKRQQLISIVFGDTALLSALRGSLANSTEDRKIRECIEALQAKDYPIVSSSGKPGYILAADSATTDAYIAEIGSRIQQMQKKQAHLRRSKGKIALVRAWMAGQTATQDRLL
jgi:DNA-binding winged helix-turn-helix (wHTH) protein